MLLKIVIGVFLIHAVQAVASNLTEEATAPDQLQLSTTTSKTAVENYLNFIPDTRTIPQTCLNHGPGIQLIQPQFGFSEPFPVVCDQYYSGGGWTVIQNRFDGAVNFYRGWAAYENGFGDLFGEFWLGLKRMHELTHARRHELRIVLEDFDGRTAWARYSDFSVAGPEEKYKLKSLGTYSGTAGDSLKLGLNQYFTTFDVDNDQDPINNCAAYYYGGWWHKSCHTSNLNGLYLPGPQQEYGTMMCWKDFRGFYYGLKSSRMMIRVVDYMVTV